MSLGVGLSEAILFLGLGVMVVTGWGHFHVRRCAKWVCLSRCQNLQASNQARKIGNHPSILCWLPHTVGGVALQSQESGGWLERLGLGGPEG